MSNKAHRLKTRLIAVALAAAAAVTALPSIPGLAAEWTTGSQGTYVITNEPYHSLSFVKKSSYNQAELDGAIFHLTGTSDEGTRTDMYAVSGVTPGTKSDKDKDGSALWYSGLYVSKDKTDNAYTVGADPATGDSVLSLLSKKTWDETTAYRIAASIQYSMKQGDYGNKKITSSNSDSGMTGATVFNMLERGTYVLQEVAAPVIYYSDGTSETYTADPSKYVVRVRQKEGSGL